MLAREAQRALVSWEPVSSRIITAKFATGESKIHLNVIQCYAPANDAEEEKKDDVYHQLETVLDETRQRDITNHKPKRTTKPRGRFNVGLLRNEDAQASFQLNPI
ncbi:hypothetical protein Bbelb_021750 [Branchiostoma belcheri]|nr:hypothetical protein Bbelb_021750 [Branchiostoma belcheri]